MKDLKILTKSEVEKRFFGALIRPCEQCGNMPIIIEKLIQRNPKSLFKDKQYNCRCEKCGRETNFQNNWRYMIQKWNKMVYPLKYVGQYVFSFYPDEKEGDVTIKDFPFKFRVDKHQICHEKGGERYLYYMFDDEVRKLDLQNFNEDVAIYQTQFGLGVDIYKSFKVCVAIAGTDSEARDMINDRLKWYFTSKKEQWEERLSYRIQALEETKSELETINKYVKMWK